MTRLVTMSGVHEMQARMAENLGPQAMILFESIEAACRQVVRKNNSHSAIFGLYGFPRNQDLCELYAFLLLRHPRLRLSLEQTAEYLLTDVESVKNYEAGGVLMTMGAAPGDACARLTLACTILGIEPRELVLAPN